MDSFKALKDAIYHPSGFSTQDSLKFGRTMRKVDKLNDTVKEIENKENIRRRLSEFIGSCISLIREKGEKNSDDNTKSITLFRTKDNGQRELPGYSYKAKPGNKDNETQLVIWEQNKVPHPNKPLEESEQKIEILARKKGYGYEVATSNPAQILDATKDASVMLISFENGTAKIDRQIRNDTTQRLTQEQIDLENEKLEMLRNIFSKNR